MNINIIEPKNLSGFEPLTCTRKLSECQVAGLTLGEHLLNKIYFFTKITPDISSDFEVNIRSDFWPSYELLEVIFRNRLSVIDRTSDDQPLLYFSDISKKFIEPDEGSFLLKYSWDLLKLNEEIIGSLSETIIEGTVKDSVSIDGKVEIGEGTVLLPGVYIEGNAIIGKNCKIGPNCYIRGNTHIGNNCHVGQAVEIKNSILMDNVSVGHLGYVGDAIIGEKTNFGAGTIMANLRHDGKNHRSAISGELIDTGRRKFGVIVGDHVHTGINTTLYPGRKIWPNSSTKPGEVVSKDILK